MADEKLRAELNKIFTFGKSDAEMIAEVENLIERRNAALADSRAGQAPPRHYIRFTSADEQQRAAAILANAGALVLASARLDEAAQPAAAKEKEVPTGYVEGMAQETGANTLAKAGETSAESLAEKWAEALDISVEAIRPLVEQCIAAGRAASGEQPSEKLTEHVRAFVEKHLYYARNQENLVDQLLVMVLSAPVAAPAAAPELSEEQVREFAQQFGRTVAYTASIHLATTQKAQSERVAQVLEKELNALLRSKAEGNGAEQEGKTYPGSGC